MPLPPHISIVIGKTRNLIRQHTPPGGIQILCEKKLDLFEGETRKQGFAPCIDFPYQLACGLGGERLKAEAVSVLCTLVFLGCDLLDDFHDNDLPQDEDTYSAPQVTLASSVFLTVLPTLAASALLPASLQMEACRLIAETLAIMAAGQSRDVQSRFNADLSVEEIEANIRDKSGEEMALFCRLATLVSDKSKCKTAVEFGRQMAMALQMATDLADLFSRMSKDLKEGTFTIPLALHVLRLTTKEKSSFMRLWHEGTLNPNVLKESGAAAHTAFMIETRLTRGEKTLTALSLQPGPLNSLKGIMEEVGNYSLIHLQAYLKAPFTAPKMREAQLTILGM